MFPSFSISCFPPDAITTNSMFASVQCNDFVENSENTEHSDDFDFHGTQNVMCRVPLMLSCRGSFQEVFWICVYNFLAVPSAELNELLMCHEACAASLYVRPFIIKEEDLFRYICSTPRRSLRLCCNLNVSWSCSFFFFFLVAGSVLHCYDTSHLELILEANWIQRTL